MFKCQITGKLSRQGDPRTGELYYVSETEKSDTKAPEKPHRIVVETRAVEYKHWDREAEEEWFTQGTEIVRELNVSDEGLAIWERMTPEQRTEFLKRA